MVQRYEQEGACPEGAHSLGWECLFLSFQIRSHSVNALSYCGVPMSAGLSLHRM